MGHIPMIFYKINLTYTIEKSMYQQFIVKHIRIFPLENPAANICNQITSLFYYKFGIPVFSNKKGKKQKRKFSRLIEVQNEFQRSINTWKNKYLFPLEQGFPIFFEESAAMKDQLAYQLSIEDWSPPCSIQMYWVQKVPS